MSRDSQPSGRGHFYGHVSGDGHDRHIERITEYTNSLFPEPQYRLPQIYTPSSIDWNQDGIPGESGRSTDDLCLYGGLDDFGKPLLDFSMLFAGLVGAAD